MAVKHESTRVAIDLTQVPYYPAPAEPLVLQEASGFERVRESVEDADTTSTYRIDRHPKPDRDSQCFGGLGLAAVMDVSAHPLRARARGINVLTIFAITAVVTVAAVMAMVVGTFRP
jgi:hypothetical protein